MINSSNHFHSNHWILARLGAAALCGILGITVVLAFLSAFGIQFQGFSDTWQSLIIIGVLIFLCGILSWPTLIPERSRAGQYMSLPRKNSQITKYGAHVSVLLFLLLLWLGVRTWPETKEEKRTVYLVRIDKSFSPPDPGQSQAFLYRTSPQNESVPIIFEDAFEKADNIEKHLGSGLSAWKLRKGEERRPIQWVRIGKVRWPIIQPPDELEVMHEANLDITTVGSKVGPLLVTENRSFPLQGMLLPTLPTQPIAFPDPLERFGGPGFKPMFGDVAGISSHGMSLFQWGSLPAKTSLKPFRLAGNDEVFTLFTDTYEKPEDMVTDNAPASIRAQVDALSVSHRSGLPEYFLVTPLGAGVDTTGDAGLLQGVAVLDGAIRIWRTRRYSARASWGVSEEPPARRPTTFLKLASERFLPAPRTPMNEERRTGQEFPRNIGLLAVTVILVLYCATRR